MGLGMKLTKAREDLAAIVADLVSVDVGVVDHLPDAIAPPVCLIAWGDPWITPATLCAYEANMEVLIIAQRLEPGGKLETLEAVVSTIVPGIKSNQGFQVVDATSPYPIQIGGVDYLAASINIKHDVED